MTRTIISLAALVALIAAVPGISTAGEYMPRYLDVVNEGYSDILFVRMSDVGRTSFGGDLLGDSQVVEPGEAVRVRADLDRGYCRFDVQVEFEDGTTTETFGIDICYGNTLYVNNF